MTEVVQVVWIAFAIGVVYSFCTLGIQQLKIGRPHVAAMAASYTLLVLVQATGLDNVWATTCLVLSLIFGSIGLGTYWTRKQ